MSRRPILIVVVAIRLADAGGGGYLLRDRLARSGAAPVPSSPQAAAGLGIAEALQLGFVDVAQHVRPAVVHLGTIQRAKNRRGPNLPQGNDDPFFRDFFNQFFGSEGPDSRSEFRRPGLGSGVIIDKRGLVLTNFHVVKGADEILIRLSDKREYRGQILGTDPKTDLAVVKFQPDHEVTVASLGNSDALRGGEWAIAIGNPFGLDQSVTVGVISATGRSDVGIATYENFIQTDASINPGNSGGPLVNLKGQVIGVNTAIVAAGQGIGFAIPINMVKRIVAQLIEGGKVRRGWLGAALQPLSPDLAQSLGLAGTNVAGVGSRRCVHAGGAFEGNDPGAALDRDGVLAGPRMRGKRHLHPGGEGAVGHERGARGGPGKFGLTHHAGEQADHRRDHELLGVD